MLRPKAGYINYPSMVFLSSSREFLQDLSKKTGHASEILIRNTRFSIMYAILITSAPCYCHQRQYILKSTEIRGAKYIDVCYVVRQLYANETESYF
jgi:hypothetical protein